MTDQDAVRVECYSGYSYAQEPGVVLWQEQRYPVARIESRWRTPEGPAFFIEVESGERFELRYHEGRDRWLIQALPARERSGTRQAKILPFTQHAERPIRPKNTDEEVQD